MIENRVPSIGEALESLFQHFHSVTVTVGWITFFKGHDNGLLIPCVKIEKTQGVQSNTFIQGS